jgi:hypothetical protein
VSSLSDQVEVKVARAKRAFKRSTKILGTARGELQDHQRWLDNHRVAWSKEVERDRRLLKRKEVIWTCKRLALGMLLLPFFAFVALLRQTIWILLFLRDLLAISSARIGEFAHTLGRFLKEMLSRVLLRITGHHQLQARISRLDGHLWNRKVDSAPPESSQTERTGENCSPVSTRSGRGLRELATLLSLVEGRVQAAALGTIMVTLVAAGAVRATIPGRPEAPVLTAPAVLGFTRPATAVPAAAPIAPREVVKPPPSSTSVSGFSVLVGTAVPEPQSLSAQTIANMMLITSPLALAPVEPETATEPIAEETLVAKPAVKAKPKRKLVRREPQQLPWWQRWSWIRVR